MKRIRRRIFTDTTIANLQRRSKRYTKSDPEQRGLYVRVMPKGPHVFVVVVRNPFGTQIWATLGTTAEMKIDEAREKSRICIRRIQAGKPAIEPPKLAPDSVEVVCKNWLQRVAFKNKYRSADEKERIIGKYIVPHFKGRAFIDLKRSDIAALLDYVEDKHGKFQADAVLSVLRTVAVWVAKRDDNYQPPFVRGMARVPTKDRARSRILTDDELRAVWNAADGAYGALVKLLLLTAQRRGVVLGMRWTDIDLRSGVWDVPQQDRAKGTGGSLKLPEMALSIIRSMPRMVGRDHVFALGMDLETGKAKLEAASGVSGYTLHDLRRTARSLLSRTNVRPDVAERVLGHTVGGVAGIYDRHHYDDKKAEALAELAALINTIVNPPSDDNVVPLREAAAVS